MNFSYNFVLTKWTNLKEEQKKQLIDLDRAHFPRPWQPQDWASFLENSGREDALFLCLDSNHEHAQVCGFALFLIERHCQMAHLLKILCHPEHRNKGLALKLLAMSGKALKTDFLLDVVELEVSQKNHSAMALYDKVGYRKVRVVKGFYSNGENAEVRQRSL